MKEMDILRLLPGTHTHPLRRPPSKRRFAICRFWAPKAKGGKSHPADGRRVGRASSVTVGPRAGPDCVSTSRWPNLAGEIAGIWRGSEATYSDFLDLLDRWIARNLRKAEMIPDTEAVCQTSEAAVDNGGDMYEKIKDRAEKEMASVTAWKRYQRLVTAMESRGGEFNRKSLIEAIFRGSDLVYADH
ncbi:uncharacterized protein [Polyergus mexicanus]|uniref:uncharacterized protein isoform X1 n=2 Tax=Polyergus mexicanus TaxID=615972 RepID=UPI0038B6400C